MAFDFISTIINSIIFWIVAGGKKWLRKFEQLR